MNQIDIPKIITYLKTITSLANLVGSRIFHGLPINDNQDGDYITIRAFGGTNEFLNKGVLCQFNFIGVDENARFEDLKSILKLVSDNLTGNKDLSGFYVYGCNEEGNFQEGYDEKNRPIISQDYRFYFIK